MANQYSNYTYLPQQTPQYSQPLFPQPQGNVYMINNSLEVANVPMGAGVSVAFCFPENLCYLKTMQNGNPIFKAYKIIPYDQEPTNQNSEEPNYSQLFEEFNERLTNLEKSLKKGGRLDELL